MRRHGHPVPGGRPWRGRLWRIGRRLSVTTVALALVAAVGLPVFNLTRAIAQGRADGFGLAALYDTRVIRETVAYRLYRLGFSIAPGLVVVGRDGWLFLGEKYADVDRKRLRREGATATGRADEIADAMQRWAVWLGTQGVTRFCYTIAPDKRSVYPERAPRSYRGAAGVRLALLNDRMPEALTLDLLAPVSAGKGASPLSLYDPTDSHWNGIGAALAAQTILGALASEPGKAGALIDRAVENPRIRTTGGGDLAAFLGLESRLSRQEVTPAIPARLRREVIATAYDTGETVARSAALVTPRVPVEVTNPAAGEPTRLLWLRDSFGTALSPLVSANFRHVLQIHWYQALTDKGRLLRRLVREWRPDIVLVTVVEREALGAVFAEGPGTAAEGVSSGIPAHCRAD